MFAHLLVRVEGYKEAMLLRDTAIHSSQCFHKQVQKLEVQVLSLQSDNEALRREVQTLTDRLIARKQDEAEAKVELPEIVLREPRRLSWKEELIDDIDVDDKVSNTGKHAKSEVSIPQFLSQLYTPTQVLHRALDANAQTARATVSSAARVTTAQIATTTARARADTEKSTRTTNNDPHSHLYVQEFPSNQHANLRKVSSSDGEGSQADVKECDGYAGSSPFACVANVYKSAAELYIENEISRLEDEGDQLQEIVEEDETSSQRGEGGRSECKATMRTRFQRESLSVTCNTPSMMYIAAWNQNGSWQKGAAPEQAQTHSTSPRSQSAVLVDEEKTQGVLPMEKSFAPTAIHKEYKAEMEKDATPSAEVDVDGAYDGAGWLRYEAKILE
eukprot:439412-Hanusia_phi.AAC.1